MQLPAEAHDTEPTSAAAVPGTSSAFRQVPWTSLTTNAREPPTQYHPAAMQLPAEAHDTEVIPAYPPVLRAAVPGTSSATCQVPLTSLTNAWDLKDAGGGTTQTAWHGSRRQRWREQRPGSSP